MNQLKRSRGRPAKFTNAEDLLLLELVDELGRSSWSQIATHFENRTEKQCRDRWRNNFKVFESKDHFSEEEDELLRELIEEFGPKWLELSNYYSNRSSIDLKIRWLQINEGEVKEHIPKNNNEVIVDDHVNNFDKALWNSYQEFLVEETFGHQKMNNYFIPPLFPEET